MAEGPAARPTRVELRRASPPAPPRLAARPPRATYRLQFNADFTFAEAERLVSYLDELGISDVYASPLFAAAPGSPHGYDVVDPTTLNPEIGGERGLRRLIRALRAHGMGLIVDVVPNHMSMASARNRWWADVLEFGPGSPYAAFFDVNWHPPREDLENRVLLPVLAEPLRREIERGRIRIAYRAGSFIVRYGGSRYPLAARTQVPILDRMLHHARTAGADQATTQALASVRDAHAALPGPAAADPARMREVRRSRRAAAEQLRTLLATRPAARAAAFSALAELNARQDAERVHRLEELLDAQAYKLDFWQVASEALNYRRFFDVNELAALRMEEPRAFRAVHQGVLDQLRRGGVTGLRIDHIDGLANPARYLRDLNAACARALAHGHARPASAPTDGPRAAEAREPACYLVVEKILECDERLRSHWEVDGTTGYEALNELGGFFVERRGARRLREIYTRFTGTSADWRALRTESRIFALRVLLATEVRALMQLLEERAATDAQPADGDTLEDALVQLIAALPVYRTYLECGDAAIHPEDRRLLDRAAAAAKAAMPATAANVDWLASQLSARPADAWQCRFITRFQQACAATAAKGVEDTAFYRWYPLVSLNEVGGDPATLGMTPARLHARNATRQRDWPHSLVATATHDTKRGEDTRMRIHALSETPDEWREAIRDWAALNAGLRPNPGTHERPTANEEYLLYQTLIGTWPAGALQPEPDYADRIVEYMRKAMREAKQNSSWTEPAADYEDAVEAFVRAALDPARSHAFLSGLSRFARATAQAGMLEALAQLTLKVASPGVPDFYQGTELWSLSLVDPDNRRPVDYDARIETARALAEDARPALDIVTELLETADDGRIKLWLTRRLLEARRRFDPVFREGDYLPLHVRGPRRDHVIAFARQAGDAAVIAVAGRWFIHLGAVPRPVMQAGPETPPADAGTGTETSPAPTLNLLRPGHWAGTTIELPPAPNGRWVEALTDRAFKAEETLDVGRLLAPLPAALLVWQAAEPMEPA